MSVKNENYVSMIFDIVEVESKIGYCFKDKALLRLAYTHSSYANEHKTQSNEALEFLGDAVLGLVVAEDLYKNSKNKQEGQMTKDRANLVSAQALYEFVLNLGIGDHILLGVGEAKSGIKNKKNVFCDLFEATVAAIYLDGGLENAKKFILGAFKKKLNKGNEANGKNNKNAKASITKDFKTTLQEYVQKNKLGIISYQLKSQSGKSHNPEFVFAVLIGNVEHGVASGNNKKTAQQGAAQKALISLGVID